MALISPVAGAAFRHGESVSQWEHRRRALCLPRPRRQDTQGAPPNPERWEDTTTKTEGGGRGKSYLKFKRGRTPRRQSKEKADPVTTHECAQDLVAGSPPGADGEEHTPEHFSWRGTRFTFLVYIPEFRRRGHEKRGNQEGAQNRTQNRAQSIAGHTADGRKSSSGSTPPLGKGKLTFKSRSKTYDYSLLSSLQTTLENDVNESTPSSSNGGPNQESNHDHPCTAPQPNVP